MDRRQDRRVDEPAVGQRQEVEAVVDDVELVGALERVRDVEALDDLGLDARDPPSSPRRPPKRAGRRSSSRAVAKSVTSTPSRDEPLGEQRCELLPRPVVARRHPPRDRREHRDPQRRHGASSPETRRAPATIASSLREGDARAAGTSSRSRARRRAARAARPRARARMRAATTSGVSTSAAPRSSTPSTIVLSGSAAQHLRVELRLRRLERDVRRGAVVRAPPGTGSRAGRSWTMWA